MGNKDYPTIGDKRMKLTSDMKHDICRGYLVGVSVSDIAEAYSISTQTVYRVLKQNNIKTQKK